jgi:hypothetical protein
LRRIAESGGSGLQWFQPDFTGLFEVILEQEVLATLRTTPGQRGLEGLGEAAEGSWTFAAKGLVRRYTEVAAGGGEVGRFRGSAGGAEGTLEIAGNRVRYGWARIPQPATWRFSDADGRPLLEFLAPPRTDVSSRALSARIEVDPSALASPDLPLLVLLCGYLMVRGDGAPTLELEDTERKLGVKDLYGFLSIHR